VGSNPTPTATLSVAMVRSAYPPKNNMTIAICCSKKFKKEARKVADQLRKLGIAVYEPPLPEMSIFDGLTDQQQYYTLSGLTHNHFSKIRKSDAIYVLNINSYIGVAVTIEIAYAAALNKKIFYMEEEKDELVRKVLCDGYAKTPLELKKKLNELKTLDIID
jgi:hypothetical protein